MDLRMLLLGFMLIIICESMAVKEENDKTGRNHPQEKKEREGKTEKKPEPPATESAAAESGKKKEETGTNEYELTTADYACAEDNNKYRRLHKDTPDSHADLEITIKAQERADYLVTEKSGKLIYRTWKQRKPWGESLTYKGYDKDKPVDKLVACKYANALWYSEVNNWDFTSGAKKAGAKRSTHHFTQMVWEDSTKIGYGVARYENKIVIVAQYYKAGNWAGKYQLKVKKLLTDPSDIGEWVEVGDETEPSEQDAMSYIVDELEEYFVVRGGK